MKLNDQHITALRAIEVLGPIGGRDLYNLQQMSAFGDVRARTIVAKLVDTGHVDAEQGSQYEGHTYTASARGARLLRKLDATPPPLNIALPRRAVLEGRYHCPELRPFTGRAGAMAAFDLPSLRGDALVPRGRPISMGAKPDVRR